MSSALDLMFAWCGSVPPVGGLAVGMFLAGLAGGPAHCAPMCGGFVLGQVADRMVRLPAHHLCEWRRAGLAVLAPYHLGPITTYALLGGFAGAAGALTLRYPAISGALLLTAALFCLWRGIGGALPSVPASVPWGRWIARRTRTISRGGFAAEYAMGLLLGLLPCGLLYGALIAAAAAPDMVSGGAAMAAFGLGTVPTLIAVGVLGQAAGRRWMGWLRAVMPGVMLLNALLLTVLAAQRLATL